MISRNVKVNCIILVLSFLSLSLYSTIVPTFSTAGFYQLDNTGRSINSMNVAWRFIKMEVPNAEKINFDDSKWEVVSIPHGLEY